LSNILLSLYTDGACSGNPGPGGWAAVLLYGEKRLELSGFEPATTNNRMEIMAAIRGLQTLKRPCALCVYTDSTYLAHAVSRGWLARWQANDWRKADKKPVENIDLWQELLQAMAPHTITWQHVRGHADNEENNRCDTLARAEIQRNR